MKTKNMFFALVLLLSSASFVSAAAVKTPVTPKATVEAPVVEVKPGLISRGVKASDGVINSVSTKACHGVNYVVETVKNNPTVTALVVIAVAVAAVAIRARANNNVSADSVDTEEETN